VQGWLCPFGACSAEAGRAEVVSHPHCDSLAMLPVNSAVMSYKFELETPLTSVGQKERELWGGGHHLNLVID
jgi:hypothetical protein